MDIFFKCPYIFSFYFYSHFCKYFIKTLTFSSADNKLHAYLFNYVVLWCIQSRKNLLAPSEISPWGLKVLESDAEPAAKSIAMWVTAQDESTYV